MLENRRPADSDIIAYRPDIDGLRAVAVLAVIAYHFSRNSLPGGYLGVDIFFVLSGYLITAIIWREISAGDFSLIRFYGRRIRRILPALMAMLIIVSAASLVILLPADLAGFSKSLFATLGFAANIYFWRDTNYFSGTADEKPLLHLWSLGIEEQYYLVFPLLLLLLARKSWALPGILILGAASFALDLLALKADGAVPAFYLLPTRVWELAVGALIAFVPPAIAATPIAGYAGALLVATGIAAGSRLHPSFLPDSLFVVIGTALLILGASREKHPVGRLLSCKPLVFVGLISYSLYLWHWPILVLSKYFLVRDLTLTEKWLAALSMFALATLSWRYVEKPFRESTLPMKTVGLTVLAGMIASTLFAGAVIYQAGFPQRFTPEAARMSAAVGTNYRCAVPDYLYFEGSRACEMGLPSRDPQDADVVLFGNSHALMYTPLVREILHDEALAGLLVPENGCLPTYGVNISPACAALTDRNIDAIARLERARAVLIGTTWGAFAPRSERPGRTMPSSTELLAGLDRTIARLTASGKKVVLIGPVATPGWEVASVAGRSLAFGRPVERPLYESEQAFSARHAPVFAHFGQRNDVTLIRPDQAQCRNGRCDYVIDGRPLFADSHHLSQTELGIFHPAFKTAMTLVSARH